MAARCEKCGYHLEPAEKHLGHHGCLVCQRDEAIAKNAELAVFVEAFIEVCEAHAGASGESVRELLDKALELEM